LSVLTRKYVRDLIARNKKYLDRYRDYDLGKWRPSSRRGRRKLAGK